MKRSTSRRFITWLTALAMLAGSILPMHALGHVGAKSGLPGSDYCTTVPGAKPAPGTPAGPAADRQCAACCASTGGTPALLGTASTVALVAGASIAPLPLTAIAVERTVAGGNARAPPRLS